MKTIWLSNYFLACWQFGIWCHLEYHSGSFRRMLGSLLLQPDILFLSALRCRWDIVCSRCLQAVVGILLLCCWRLHWSVYMLIQSSYFSLLYLFFLFCRPQQKGRSRRFGLLAPSAALLLWTPSRGRTSPASGPETPTDPTPPVWKTKPHRYCDFKVLLC